MTRQRQHPQRPLHEIQEEELRLALGASGACIDPQGQPASNAGSEADPYGGPK